jgi:hypothetical protein
MRARAVVALLSLAACASAPRPAGAPVPIRPLARSSIAAVLAHRGELELSDDQVRRMEDLADQLGRANEAIRATLKEAREKQPSAGARPGSAAEPGAGGMGSGRGGRGMRGGGGRDTGLGRPDFLSEERASVFEKARQQMDDNDAKAFEDAAAALTAAQRPRAREIAERYREELYDWREATQRQGGREDP